MQTFTFEELLDKAVSGVLDVNEHTF